MMLTLTILNWAKYNPKRDQKTYTWLRLDNSINTDPDLFGLDAEQKLVWIEILCQASKQAKETISVSIDYLTHITGVKKEKISALLEFLIRKPIISYTTPECRDHDNARPHADVTTTPTYVRTNETNETNVRARPPGVVKELSKEVNLCMDEWKATLKHFGIERPLGERDEIEIARGVKTYSTEWVKLAFAGMRKQTKGPKFDPAQFVSLAIAFDPKRIERLVNIGSGKESVSGIDWARVFEK